MKNESIINRLYFSDRELTKTEFEKSRNRFIFEGAVATGLFGLTTGAFLAGFAKYMGATDQFNGLIAAIPAFAGIVQMVSPILFEKLSHRKVIIAICCLIFRSLLSFMVLIPLIFSSTSIRLISLAVVNIIAYTIASFISPAASNWMADLTPEHIRGRYFATKDMYALVFMTIITLICGKILDYFKFINNEYTGFLIIGLISLILAILNFIFISSVKEPPPHKSTFKISLRKAIIEPIKNHQFKKIIVLSALWNLGLNFAGPFFSVYMVANLKLDYTYIMVVGVIATSVRVLSVRFWGRLADRKSWFLPTKISIALVGLAHFSWFFVNINTMYILIPLINILVGFAWAGVNICIFNIQFIFAPKDGRTMYLGSSAAIGGLVGFISSILGSVILSLIGPRIFNLIGFNVSNMQIIFACSGIALGLCALYIHIFIKKNQIEKSLTKGELI
ncbi:MAG TPA: MFS transporter [Clostridiaceae bacterium]